MSKDLIEEIASEHPDDETIFALSENLYSTLYKDKLGKHEQELWQPVKQYTDITFL